MRTIAWRAFHTDERITVAERDLVTAFSKLPETGFLSLVLYHDRKRPDGKPYRTIVDGGDHYVAYEGENGPQFESVNTPRDVIEAEHPGCVIKLGTEIPIEEFRKVNAQAMAAV